MYNHTSKHDAATLYKNKRHVQCVTVKEWPLQGQTEKNH